jgi:glycerophosphoryl diester phosphodiesterase
MTSLVRGKPSLARGLCLRLRTVPEGAALAALAAMTHGGIAVSALPRHAGLGSLASAGVSHIRVPAGDLVDPYSARRIPAWQAVEAARSAGLSVIAVGVGTMEDAARLLDEGIDLMSGPAFAEPKRLRATERDRELPEARRRPASRAG